ncbi:MAG: AAA family ATPase [Thiolinea sp.]
MSNPFTIRGTIQNPAEFIGREEEIAHILSRIRTEQSCSVVGERRIGKSSLLYHLYQTGQQRLQDARFRFVYIELTAANAQTQVDFLQTVLKHLDLPTERIQEGNRPHRNLVAFDELLQEQSQRDDCCAVLCLDEFEALFANATEFNDLFFNHLRSMVNGRRVVLVTASREALEVYSVQEKLTSPFFNLLSVVELGDFSEQAIEAFLRHYQPQVQFTQQELEFIDRYAEPMPLKLQIFCDVLWQWRQHPDWDNDRALEKITKIYAQFLGHGHKLTKAKQTAVGLFSSEKLGHWLANLKAGRDLFLGSE